MKPALCQSNDGVSLATVPRVLCHMVAPPGRDRFVGLLDARSVVARAFFWAAALRDGAISVAR